MVEIAACVAVDYFATLAVTAILVLIYIFMRKMYLSPPIRISLTLVTGVFVSGYIYTTFLVGMVTSEFVNWLIGFLALIFVLLVSFYLNSQILVLGLLLVLTLYGFSWPVVFFSSLAVGVLFAGFVFYYELDYLGLLIWDSMFLSLGITMGILSVVTNLVMPSQIPPTCRVPIKGSNDTDIGHLNMLIPCDPLCGSVASMSYDRTVLLITVLALMVFRFLYVYYREVCGVQKEQLREKYQAQQILRGPVTQKQGPQKKKKNGCNCALYLAGLCGDQGGSNTTPFSQLGSGSDQKKKKKSKNRVAEDDEHFAITVSGSDDETMENESDESEEVVESKNRKQKKKKDTVVSEDLEEFVREVAEDTKRPSPSTDEAVATVATVEVHPEVKADVQELQEVRPSAKIVKEVQKAVALA